MLRTYPSPISGDPLGTPIGHREPTRDLSADHVQAH
jgi:hypothetical protein